MHNPRIATGRLAADAAGAAPAAIVDQLIAVLRDLLFATTERRRAMRDAMVAFTVRITSAALLYLTQILLARWIGVFDYGIYVFVWTWMLVLGGLVPLGLNISVIRLLPEYLERRRNDLARGLVRGVRTFALGAGTAVAAIGMAGLWLFGSAIENYYVLPAYLVLFCIPVYALTDVQDGIGRAQSWMAVALIPPYVLRPFLLLAAMTAAHVAGLQMTAVTAVGAAIFATWATGLMQALIVNWRLDAEIRHAERRYEFGSWLQMSLPLAVIAACDLILQNVDVLVLSRYMAPADVGIYFAAAKTMSLIMFVHYAVGSAVANRFAALNARGDRDRLRAFVRDAVHWTFWPSFACAILILALGKPLLSLFGPEFAAGYPVMFILVIGFLLRSSFGPVEFLLNMLGEQKLCAAVLVASASINIVLNFVLVAAYGLAGAATATSLSLIFAAISHASVARWRLGLDVAVWRNMPPRFGNRGESATSN